MLTPVIRGVIDRRLLINFRVEPGVLSAVLPKPFRPQIVNGHGMAGICLIRLKNMRPGPLPPVLGFSSENAAHRIAVEWTDNGEDKSGVYVPRRDTSSALNRAVSGRLFPGVYHPAKFNVNESDGRFRVEMTSRDKKARVLVDATVSNSIPTDSVFESVDEASRFFENGSLGFSPQKDAKSFDGIELKAENWRVRSLTVAEVESSYFEDRKMFPQGSVQFDNALLMQDIHHVWLARETVSCVS